MAIRSDRTLQLQLLTDVGSIKKDVSAVEKQMSGLTKTVKAVGVAMAAGFALDTVIDFAKGAIDAARAEEAAIARLSASIKANDAAWDGNIDRIEAVIGKRQELAYSDDDLRDSLTKLTAITKDVDKAFDLQSVAMDLARLRGMDLAQAGDLVGKVYAGNLGLLSRYGIVVRKGATATEALAEIQKMSAGQAEAFAKTSAGQAERLSIALGDLTEDIGRLIMPLGDALVTAAGAAMENIRSLGEAFHDLQRFMSPHIALVEDTASELRRLAEQQGLSTQHLQAYIDMEEEAAKAQAKERQELEMLRQSYSISVGLVGELTDEQEQAFQAWRKTADGIAAYNGVMADNADAMEVSLTAQEKALLKLSQFRSAMDLATRSGIGMDAMLDEIAVRMRRLGVTWEQALGMVGQEVNEKRFRPMGAAAADAWTQSYLSGWDAAWKSTVEPETVATVERSMRKVSLTGTRSLHDGLKEGKDRVRKAAIELNQAIENPFEERAYRKYLMGQLTSKKLRDGLRSKNKEIRRQAIEMSNIIRRELVKGKVGAYNAGAGFAQSFIDGIFDTGGGALGGVGPRPKKPKKDKKPEKRAGGGPVTSGRPYIVGEDRPELFVPKTSGDILPSVPSMGGGGMTIYAPVTINAGAGSDPVAIGRELDRYLSKFYAASGGVKRR